MRADPVLSRHGVEVRFSGGRVPESRPSSDTRGAACRLPRRRVVRWASVAGTPPASGTARRQRSGRFRGGFSPAVNRRHGTAMASIILHGDLTAGEAPLPRPFAPDPSSEPERLAESHGDRARRNAGGRFDSQGGPSPVRKRRGRSAGGTARISHQPVDQHRGSALRSDLEPLARLLDWLTWALQGHERRQLRRRD